MSNQLIQVNRKYPVCRYILGVLTKTTVMDRLCKDDEKVKGISVEIAWLQFSQYCNVRSSISPYGMDLRGLRVTQTTYFDY